MHTDTKYRSVRAVLRSRSSDYFFSRWQMIVLLAVVFGMSLAVADAGTKKKLFSIEAQPARHSLTLYARQAQVQLGFAAGVNDVVTNVVIGEYDVSQALQLLLEGTGLQAEHGERGITIRPVPRAEGAGSIDEPATTVAETTSLKLVKSLTLPSAQGTQRSTASVASQSRTNESAKSGEELDNIIVTGTNIRGVTNPASPVITFDREEIENSGLATIPEFIQTIPQNFTGGFTDITNNVPDAAESGGNASNGTGVNLRGLGSDATLILLNGRRLAPAGLGEFTDISTIPASAVERIEIVLDGASAVYGADAVGGVINIILRDDFEGAETAVRYETVTDGGRDAWRATQALGTTWDSGNAFASYEFLSQSPLQNTERDFTADSAIPYDISSDSENHSIVVALSQDLVADTTLFATVNYSTREIFTNRAAFFGALTRDVSVDQYGGVAGLEWDLPGSWLAEASTAFNHYESSGTSVIPAFDITTTDELESEVWSWDARADGDLFDLLGGTAKLALGAGTRNEKFTNERSSERDVRYAFAESLIPLVQHGNAIPGVQALEVSAALRYEDYDDAGSSTDGKFGVIWSPIRGLQLRGTVGTSFRAPLLIEARPGGNSLRAQIAVDPFSPTGEAVGLLLTGSALSQEAPGLGTPLKPEESETFTIGVDFDPEFWPGFSASVSYFAIDFTDRIAAPGASANTVLVNPAFSQFVTRNPTAAQIADALAVIDFFGNRTGIPDDELISGESVDFLYDGRTINIASTTNSGFDLQFAYTTPVGAGQLSLSLSGTYLTELEDQLTPTATVIDRVDRYQSPIDIQLRGALSWSTDRLSTTVFVNYADSYEDDRQTPAAPIDSFTTIDWTVSYDLGDPNAASLFRNVYLLFGAMNILDEDPPFVDGSSRDTNINFDARNASAFGRILFLQITKKWLGGSR